MKRKRVTLEQILDGKVIIFPHFIMMLLQLEKINRYVCTRQPMEAAHPSLFPIQAKQHFKGKCLNESLPTKPPLSLV